MTLEEYTTKLHTSVLKADEAPAIVQEIIDSLKTDLTELDTYKQKTQEQEDAIKTLRETNYKLLLRDPGNTGNGHDTTEEFDPDQYKAGIERANAIAEHINKKSRFEERFHKADTKGDK